MSLHESACGVKPDNCNHTHKKLITTFNVQLNCNTSSNFSSTGITPFPPSSLPRNLKSRKPCKRCLSSFSFYWQLPANPKYLYWASIPNFWTFFPKFVFKFLNLSPYITVSPPSVLSSCQKISQATSRSHPPYRFFKHHLHFLFLWILIASLLNLFVCL